MTREQPPQITQDDKHEEQEQGRRRWPRRTVLAGAAAATLGGGAVGTVQAQESSLELDIQPNPVPDGQRFTITATVCKEGSTLDFFFGSAAEVDLTIGVDGVDQKFRRDNQIITACTPYRWRLHTNDLSDQLDKHHVYAWTQHDYAEEYLEVR